MHHVAPTGFGWRDSWPDFRDYRPESPPVRELLRRAKPSRGRRMRRVRSDLREYLPAVYDQQGLPTSPAQAVAAMADYFERRSHGRSLDPSRLFLYQATCKLLGVPIGEAVDLRATLAALVRFGSPPERLWPHEASRLLQSPEPFLYGFAQPYQSITYVRLDERGIDGGRTLDVVRTFLTAGFPAAFGLGVPSSISREADIPYRPEFDSILGGTAWLAVGHDDRRLGATRGALLVRSAWGEPWGDQGYFWLPYAYVEQQLATSFWTLLRAEWLDSGEFIRPA